MGEIGGALVNQVVKSSLEGKGETKTREFPNCSEKELTVKSMNEGRFKTLGIEKNVAYTQNKHTHTHTHRT